jgi:hypothetical protein
MDENTGVRLKIQIVHPQPYQLGEAQSSSETKVNHGAIPDADSIDWLSRLHIQTAA